MRNLRLDICYDGTKYKGWQRLSVNDLTVQGKLEQILSRLLGEQIKVFGSGRTDSGTHAFMQVVNFYCHSTMTCEEILAGLRTYLPEDMGVYSCRNVSERFHARLNVRKKTYCYRVWNSNEPCVFDRKYVYVYSKPLDVDAMNTAAQYFLGAHDFSAFCGNKHIKKSAVRTIYSFEVFRQKNEITFTVTGNGFLQHMVRIMVGTLLLVGNGERPAENIQSLFGASRADAGPTVPANGLCLMEVIY